MREMLEQVRCPNWIRSENYIAQEVRPTCVDSPSAYEAELERKSK